MGVLRNRMTEVLRKHWFDIALLVVVMVAAAFPKPLLVAADHIQARTVVVMVMFLMSVTLPTRQILGAVRRPLPVVAGVVLGFTVMPLLAFLAARIEFGLRTDFGIGMIIVASMPCTLASAAIFTRIANGNDALSLLITLASNLFSFVATPLVLTILLGVAAGIQPLVMMQKLLLLIVVPVGLGQTLRRARFIGRTADRHKPIIGHFSQVLILAMVFSGMVKAALKLTTNPGVVTPAQILLMLVTVAALHGVTLAFCALTARPLGLDGPDRIALMYGGSQKTLPASLYVVAAFFKPFALASVPCLAYHVSQLIIASLITRRVKKTWGAASSPVSWREDPLASPAP